MADIRCPMCAKPNPASAEVCRYCQARLKPLTASSGDAGAPARRDDAGVPDWLSGLVPAEDDLEPGADFQPENTESDVTDWLSRLGGEEGVSVSPEARQEPLPDWLTASTPTQAGDPNLPDWMEELGVEAQPSAGPQAQASAEEEDWLKRIRTRRAEETVESTPFAGPPVGTQPLGQEGNTALPDWLTSPETGSSASDQSAGLPDWFTQAEPADTAAALPADDLPDWLQSSDQSFGDLSQPAEPATDLPDWLIQAEAQTSAADDGAPAGATPDWLRAPGLNVPAEPAEELPDWMAGDRPETERSASFVSDAVDQNLPDWVTNTPAQAFDDLGGAGYPAASGLPAAESMPDWLSRLGAPAKGESPSPSVPAFVMDQEGDGSLSPGSGLEDLSAGEMDVLPDWLSRVSAEPSPVEHVSPIEIETAPDLAPAQLPTWLEAMRPVEAAAPLTPFADETDRQKMESAGPLAGLRGALTAEPDVVSIRKPPAYSIKMHVPDAQQATINLLQEMMAAEGQVKPLAPPSRSSSQSILRIVALVVLLAAVALTVWSGPIMALPSADALPGVADLFDSLNRFPASAPALLAFDYEPAFSGEMDAAASAVVQYFVATKGPYLTLMSTSPTGPALAESFLSRIGVQSGMTLTQVANLGYIPGGQNGLLAFARQPDIVAPYALDAFVDPDYIDVWSGNPLQAGKGLSNFGLILVMTDKPDTARAWIEQVGPALPESIPLLMVVSAQAEPLVRPYYDSGQVDGLISGLVDGAAFENQVGYHGLARMYWDALSAGLFATSVLILIGAVLNSTLALLNRSQQKKGKKAI